MEALKPCPFCGDPASTVEVIRASDGSVSYSVGCHDEDCIGFQSMATFARKAQAIAAWNCRADPAPALVEALKELRAVLGDTPMPDCATMNRLLAASSKADAALSQALGGE